MTKALALLRLRPFDVSTEAGRANERGRRIGLTVVTGALSRFMALAGPLITIPLILSHYGAERYGLWMTITSLFGMFAFADLGLGNSLLTLVSQASGGNDQATIRRCITSAYVVLTGTALVLSLIFVAAYPWISWSAVVNAGRQLPAAEIAAVSSAVILFGLVNIPSSVILRVQMALQEGYQSNIWACVASLLSLGLICVAVGQLHFSFVVLVTGVAAVVPVVSLVNAAFFFTWQRRDFCPTASSFDLGLTRRLLGTGSHYVVLSILGAVSLYSDNLIIAHLCDLQTVARYAVPARLASILMAVITIICVPLWPANGEALARGDLAWVRRNTARMVGFAGLLSMVGAVGLVVAGPYFLEHWVGKEMRCGLGLLTGLGAMAVAMASTSPLFMVLNAAGRTKPQIKAFAVFVPISLLLKYVFCKQFGPAGVAWAGAVSYLVILTPFIFGVTLKTLRNYGGNED